MKKKYKNKTLFAFLAHPDDESFGPGGTLAKYTASGIDVHICIATDGAAASVAKGHEDARLDLVEVRRKELDKAVEILGATLHRVDYQDSGMRGDASNAHPLAFINGDTQEGIGKLVKLIRSIQPDVVMTHNETGDYFHTDHIRCYELGTRAFFAAADLAQYGAEYGKPYMPAQLVYPAISKWGMTVTCLLMRLKGIDPTKIGRNEDIDLTKLGIRKERIHYKIAYRKQWPIKIKASQAHASQGGGKSSWNLFPAVIQHYFLSNDMFIQAVPEPSGKRRKKDFF